MTLIMTRVVIILDQWQGGNATDLVTNTKPEKNICINAGPIKNRILLNSWFGLKISSTGSAENPLEPHIML